MQWVSYGHIIYLVQIPATYASCSSLATNSSERRALILGLLSHVNTHPYLQLSLLTLQVTLPPALASLLAALAVSPRLTEC
jgi:hypothetical protein